MLGERQDKNQLRKKGRKRQQKNKDQLRKKGRKIQQKNKDQLRQKGRKSQQKNKNQLRKKGRKRQQKNKDQLRQKGKKDNRRTKINSVKKEEKDNRRTKTNCVKREEKDNRRTKTNCVKKEEKDNRRTKTNCVKRKEKDNRRTKTRTRLNEKKASAISKQVKRIKGNIKIQNSKWNKNSNLNPIKERLLSALGGNALNRTSGGKPFNSTSFISTSDGAFSNDTLTTLLRCECDIAEKCGNPMTGNADKLAELELCESLADNFKSEFSKCFAAGKTMAESCACVEDISESNVLSMQDCEVTADNKAALTAKKACKWLVNGKCKTAEAGIK